MAARAAARAVEREAVEAAADGHAGHHSHLQGAWVVCSCGEVRGITSVALPPEAADPAWEPPPVSCARCGAVGVVLLCNR